MGASENVLVEVVGEPLPGKGSSGRHHFNCISVEGHKYQLGDCVLLEPEEKSAKPYVALIKELWKNKDGEIGFTGYWFYRPEEALKDKSGHRRYVTDDPRELYLSFHLDECPAEAITNRCKVYFLPENKELQMRSCYICRKVYDPSPFFKLYSLDDDDFLPEKQAELQSLMSKSQQEHGEEGLKSQRPITLEKAAGASPQKRKRLVKKSELTPKKSCKKSDQQDVHDEVEDEEPVSNDRALLEECGALTHDEARDRVLEKLLSAVRGGYPEGSDDRKTAEAVKALEAVGHEDIGEKDAKKYQNKMRSLVYNLQHNRHLAARFVRGELEPKTLINMSPAELKAAMTTEEQPNKEPSPDPTPIQWTAVACKSCHAKQVAVLEVMSSGTRQVYQLECKGCGATWRTTPDGTTPLTLESPRPLDDAPQTATQKFAEAERIMEQEQDGTFRGSPAGEGSLDVPAVVDIEDLKGAGLMEAGKGPEKDFEGGFQGQSGMLVGLEPDKQAEGQMSERKSPK